MRIINITLVVVLFGIILLSEGITASANKYQLLPKANVKAGTSSNAWTTKKTTTKTTYTPITKTYKTVVSKKYDQAAEWYTGVKPVSDI